MPKREIPLMDMYDARGRASARRGAMINGCLLLVAAMAIVTTLAKAFAGYPPFHVIVATVTIMFALVLARTPDTRWQVEALAAIGAPAIVAAIYGYVAQPDTETLLGTSAGLYVAGTAAYVVTCIVRAARGGESTEGEQK